MIRIQGRSLDFISEGEQFKGSPPENFRKFAKIFLMKVQKRIILTYFTQNFTIPALIFRAFGRKTQIVGNF